MKKIIALLLACLMVIGLFAACNQTETKPTDPTDNGTEPQETPTEPEETPTDPEPTEPEEIVELTWYTVGGGEPANWESWTAKLNAYLEEKIGVHLNYQIIGWGDWGNRRTTIVQTNEPYDLMFTDMGSYAQDVNMGAFLDITDMIQNYPGLTSLIPEDYLNACKLGGKLYAVPAYKDSSMTNFFVWTTEDLQYFEGYENAHTLAAISDGLYAMKDKVGYTPVGLNADGISCITGNKYDACGLGSFGLGIAYKGGTEFVPVYEQEDVKADMALMHQWYTDGVINSDADTLTGQYSGDMSMGVSQGWPSAGKYNWGPGRNGGTEVTCVQFEDTVLSNDTVQGSMTCVSATSAHPDKALALLELVNTDYIVRDMLAYGEEGVNFNYVEENGERRVEKINTDWTGAGYTQGTFFTMSYEKGVAEPYYETEVKVQNENAVKSPALGFYCDTTTIADQISACKAIYEGYKSLLHTGAGTEEDVANMMADLRAAGFDEIQAEVNRQFQEWKAAQ